MPNWQPVVAIGLLAIASFRCDDRWTECDDDAGSIYNYWAETLDGRNISMNQYRGYTHQYADFNPFLEKYKSYGFKILAFPSNQHHLQEPGLNSEILSGLKYVRPGGGWEPHPNLHIYGKIEVNGIKEHPIYAMFKSHCPQTLYQVGCMSYFFWKPIKRNDIVWNFEKFLVDRQGRPRFRFHPGNWYNGSMIEPFLQALIAEGPSSIRQPYPINSTPLQRLEAQQCRTHGPVGKFGCPSLTPDLQNLASPTIQAPEGDPTMCDY